MTDSVRPGQRRVASDRAALERDRPGLVDALRGETGTRVLRIHGDLIPVDAAGGLRWSSPADAADAAVWAFLGRDDDGAGLLVAAGGRAGAVGWEPLRIAGSRLDVDALDRAMTAVSLGRWLLDSKYCPACGAATTLTQAGWSRQCPSCERIHFPRTDPAVIVAVTDPSGERILLGSNAAWPAGRFSCFAGFAEAGESLEDTVVREVAEEAGVVVGEVRYRGSQPWPYPRSLMLGFRAVTDTANPQADGEEIAEVRWFDRAQIAAAIDDGSPVEAGGELTLPGPASIAFTLISEWLAERR